ncbi:MAG: adenosine deaminase [Micrococcales bacterium]|nr:adenosine deaminase [Micrococcales bacterium]
MLADIAQVRALPKVELHDHLDGGLRPTTIIELANQIGFRLPASDPEALGQWFFDQANSGSLPAYLETFSVTLAVMQTQDSLAQVAREAVTDLAGDGVVHMELRFAPELHTKQGLSLDLVVDAVLAGMAEGRQDNPGTSTGLIVCSMRQANNQPAIADLALRYRNKGAVAFDLAGPEAGFGPDLFQPTLKKLRLASFPVTLHAGEGDGIVSIRQAIHLGGAVRIGHGVRLVEDIANWQQPDQAELGDLAHWLRDQAIPLELCPTSNLQTGVAKNYASHPATALKDLGFKVTINCDNRLMSQTSVSQEMWHLVDQAGWQMADLRTATLNAAQAAFLHADQRKDLINQRLAPNWPNA